jgi:oligoendopeptidase F
MARHFFASPQGEEEDRQKLLEMIAELAAFKGRIASSPENLLRCLQLYDTVQMRFRRHMDYLRLRRALNTKDVSAGNGAAALQAEILARTAFAEREFAALGDETLTSLVGRDTALKRYVYAIQALARYRNHTLSSSEEELLRGIAPAISSWQYDLYEKLRDGTQFGTVRVGGHELDVFKDRATLMSNPDRQVREAGFKKRYAGFAHQRDLYAFTLVRLARARNRLAELRHFEDAAAQAYFASEWKPAMVTALLNAVKKHAEIYKRYQRLRAARAQQIAGGQGVNLWDVSLPRPSFQTPRFTFDQSTRTIRESLESLGPEFSAEMTRLLDPANGRLDVGPGENRYPGGFSLGFVGTTSVFFGGVFRGRYDNMRVMAHEATHAVHRQLMTNANVLPAYASGPSYLFESFAVFSELLLAEHLAGSADDVALREYFLEQFVDGKGTIMFVAGPEAELEQAVYSSEKNGEIKGPDDLDALTQRIYSQYSIWPEKHKELKGQWMMIPLMYEDPFYNVNYVYAGLLALTYLDLWDKDPKGFASRYTAFMKNGFDAPAAVLLARFLGLDIQAREFVEHAMAALEKRMHKLEESYAASAR